MNKSHLTYLILALATLYGLWFSCASPGSIQGGPKDETPPQVDSAASSPTPVVNFTKRDITITFDEWVKLDDPFNNIFISPPLAHRPEYKLKKRSLIISFSEDEVLRDSTTYIINLGTSVKDITESNPLEDFQYVFSTGEELDSLGFSGLITDVLTGEPVENASVMLYDNFEDTAITTLPPAYFARTGKDGRYKFDYLRPDTFQLIAYLDEDMDFRHGEEDEPLGFIPQRLSTEEINGREISFSLSIGEPTAYLDGIDTSTTGLINLTFDQSITDSARLRLYTSPGIIHVDRLENKIRMYYDPDSLPVEVITENIMQVRDTILIKSREKKSFSQKNIEINRLNSQILPKKPLELKLNHPVFGIEESKIRVMCRDSVLLSPDTLTVGFNTANIAYPWEADSTYTLTLLPGAIIFNDSIEHDTTEFKIQPVSPDKLASLIIVLVPEEGYELPPQFILQLKEKDKILRTKITEDVEEKIQFSELKPGKYSLTVIRDENKNGIWDPARYSGRLEAEQIQTIEIENLRANWVQETEVQLKNPKN